MQLGMGRMDRMHARSLAVVASIVTKAGCRLLQWCRLQGSSCGWGPAILHSCCCGAQRGHARGSLCGAAVPSRVLGTSGDSGANSREPHSTSCAAAWGGVGWGGARHELVVLNLNHACVSREVACLIWEFGGFRSWHIHKRQLPRAQSVHRNGTTSQSCSITRARLSATP